MNKLSKIIATIIAKLFIFPLILYLVWSHVVAPAFNAPELSYMEMFLIYLGIFAIGSAFKKDL